MKLSTKISKIFAEDLHISELFVDDNGNNIRVICCKKYKTITPINHLEVLICRDIVRLKFQFESNCNFHSNQYYLN